MSKNIVKLDCNNNDIYLNCNPNIKFFKEDYKKHTKFGSEFKEILFNSNLNYGNNVEFDLKNQGDLLHKCFIEVEIPLLKFYDNVIDNDKYKTYKSNELDIINNNIKYWRKKYINMKNFSEIEIYYYKELIFLFLSENLTIELLKEKIKELNTISETDNIQEFNYSDMESKSTAENWDLDFIDELWSGINVSNSSDNKKNRIKYKKLIDKNILNSVNIAKYINNLSNYDEISNVKIELDKKYNLINKYLEYYFSNLQFNKKKYKKTKEGVINYSWSKKLGHYYFTDFEFYLNGKLVDNYDSDQLNIFKSYNLENNMKENYDNMIGHNKLLYEFNNNDRDIKKIYVPLIFWFCRDSHNAFPLISSKKSLPKIKLKINDLKNILFFTDWEKEFNDLLTIDIPLKDHNLNDNGSVKTFSNLNYDNVEIIYPEYIYRYKCSVITKKLLDLKYPGINSENIINNYGTLQIDNSYALELKDYIYLMKNIKNDIYLLEETKTKLAGYHYFIDYELLLNQVPIPKIRMYGQYIFLDVLEKKRFCSNNLEYLIELFSKEDIEIENENFKKYDFDKDILLKNLFWFTRPKLITDGLSDYNKIYNGVYGKSFLYENKMINNIDFNFNNYNLLKQNKIKNFYNMLKPYVKLNTNLCENVNFLNLSLFPKDIQPSGSFNLSQVSHKYINLSMNEDFLEEYYDINNSIKNLNDDSNIELKILMTHYNVLSFNKQECKLIFYHK